MSLPICMWSGPRNLSTAMMRSFGAREDFSVIDEPFFAPFLQVSGKDHPGRDETLAAYETNPNAVALQCVRKNKKQYCFQKHMPHHMLDEFPLEWTRSGRHFFLIREPERVIASYIKGRAEFTLDDLGFAAQRRFYETLSDIIGSKPPIIDSYDILKNPEMALRRLCEALDIVFDLAMLSWEAGSRPEDGAWAPYWYTSVENSTGFAPPPVHTPIVPDEYANMLSACKRDYDWLYTRRLRV